MKQGKGFNIMRMRGEEGRGCGGGGVTRAREGRDISIVMIIIIIIIIKQMETTIQQDSCNVVIKNAKMIQSSLN